MSDTLNNRDYLFERLKEIFPDCHVEYYELKGSWHFVVRGYKCNEPHGIGRAIDSVELALAHSEYLYNMAADMRKEWDNWEG